MQINIFIYFLIYTLKYNEALQLDPNNVGLREDMAWPARPQDTYGIYYY